MADNAYSRFVAWVKILLPLVALVLLSSLFMLSRVTDVSTRIPFAEIDVEELARKQGIEQPNYSGLTEDGRTVAVTASKARPRLTNRSIVDAVDLVADLETSGGGDLRIESGEGVIHIKKSTATLTNGVTITTSTGYTVVSDEMDVAINEMEMETDVPVQITGPAGHINAGQMHIKPSGGPNSEVIAVFKGGVKLVYLPQN